MKIALLIEYDGTDFAGWQIQPGVRTVQRELETAFEKVLQKHVIITSAGRTDSGVHARAMVAHVELENLKLSSNKLTEALNASSGRDVVIHSIKEVDSDFHSRYSALDREYRYTMIRRNTAIERNFSWYIRGDVQISAMQNAALHLMGEHDFTSFSKRSDDVEHYRCIIDKCDLLSGEDKLVLIIRANRFVRGMVRAIVGGLVEVGKNKMSEESFGKLIKNPAEEERAKYLAPPEGLFFWKVRYPEKYGLWE